MSELEYGPWSEVEELDGRLPLRWRVQPYAMQFEVIDPNDEEVEISGAVKWDGCIDWSTNEHCNYHFCEPEDVDRLSRTFDQLWLLASQNVEKWGHDFATAKLRAPAQSQQEPR